MVSCGCGQGIVMIGKFLKNVVSEETATQPSRNLF